jgi:hypothetical protein
MLPRRSIFTDPYVTQKAIFFNISHDDIAKLTDVRDAVPGHGSASIGLETGNLIKVYDPEYPSIISIPVHDDYLVSVSYVYFQGAMCYECLGLDGKVLVSSAGAASSRVLEPPLGMRIVRSLSAPRVSDNVYVLEGPDFKRTLVLYDQGEFQQISRPGDDVREVFNVEIKKGIVRYYNTVRGELVDYRGNVCGQDIAGVIGDPLENKVMVFNREMCDLAFGTSNEIYLLKNNELFVSKSGKEPYSYEKLAIFDLPNKPVMVKSDWQGNYGLVFNIIVSMDTGGT